MTTIGTRQEVSKFSEEISAEKRTKNSENSVAYSASVGIDLSLSDFHVIGSVTGNMTINLSNVEDGQTGYINFTIDSTGGYTIAAGSGTWQEFDDSDLVSDCNVASTEYFIFYVVRNSTLYYNINLVSP